MHRGEVLGWPTRAAAASRRWRTEPPGCCPAERGTWRPGAVPRGGRRAVQRPRVVAGAVARVPLGRDRDRLPGRDEVAEPGAPHRRNWSTPPKATSPGAAAPPARHAPGTFWRWSRSHLTGCPVTRISFPAAYGSA